MWLPGDDLRIRRLVSNRCRNRLRRVGKLCWALAWVATLAGPLTPDAGSARGEDWPTFRHDQRRSGVTPGNLDASRLKPCWQWRAPQRPSPAWPDAAKWDAYATLDGLRSMRDYDPVSHPIVVGQRLYLPGNADDTVRCLDVADGRELWRLTVDAPVRIAPTHHEGVLYFGADDGLVYAVTADSGEVIWRTRLAEADGLEGPAATFFNDGRICSLMPVRSGVLIDAEAGTGIASAGMFPWHGTLLGGFDLKSGQVVWRQDLGTGWTLEGAMLLSPGYVIAPQGRSAPLRFHRRDGRPAGVMSGGGGSFVLLTEDSRLFHGPGNKGGWLTETDAAGEVGDKGAIDQVASFDKGLAIVVRGSTAYLLDDRRLAAFDRRNGEFLWVTPCDCPHELILAGETLFAGGDGQVLAFAADDGSLLWRGEVEGRAIGLAAAADSLFVSTDLGVVHRFSPSGDPVDPPIIGEPAPGVAPASGPGPPVEPVSDPALLYRWLFQNDRVEFGEAGPRGPATVGSLAADGLPLKLPAGAVITDQGDEQALYLDGRTDASIADDFRDAPHPRESMTVTAWVRIDRPIEWGGLLSIQQDNGPYEKGWILGYRQRAFGFAVNGQDGPDELTWVTDPEQRIEPGRWFHVAATYDGTRAVLYIDGSQVAVTDRQRGPIDYPRRAGLHFGAYKDDDEHFVAEGMAHEVRLYRRALSADEISETARSKRDRLRAATAAGEPQTAKRVVLPPRRGPVLRFVASGAAEVRWTTESPQPTRIRLVEGQATVRVDRPDEERTEHAARLENLPPQTVARFRIDHRVGGQPATTPEYECDTHFDYSRPPLPQASPEVEAEAWRADAWLSRLGERNPRGIGLLWGCDDEGRLAEALARRSGHDVIVADADPRRVARARRRLVDAGIYGRAVSVRQAESPRDLAIPPGTLNWILVGPDPQGPVGAVASGPDAGGPDAGVGARALADLLEHLQPLGVAGLTAGWWRDDVIGRTGFREVTAGTAGLAVAAGTRAGDGTADGADDPGEADSRPVADTDRARWPASIRLARAPRPEGSAGWTHMYGTADNAAYAGEALGGVRHTDDLRVAWAGRPGPRYQSDRGNRKPSPLAAQGRLYLQGLYRTIGIDAHNGSILWALELPEVVRFNVPRDCSNWCADEENLYVAARDRCLVIDGRDGEIVHQWPVPDPRAEGFRWGYIAREGDRLIGTAVREGASFTEFWGAENWYDGKDGEHAKKVCSDSLFALDPGTGHPLWQYRRGLIVNPTVTIRDGRIHFVECRSDRAIEGDSRRLDGPDFWDHLHLVTLELDTGRQLWETPAKPMEGESAFYLVAAGESLLMQTSKGGAFAVYAIDAATGQMRWRGRYEWEADHHGKHLSRPAVVEGKVYLRPLTLDLAGGEVLAESFPAGHQCGTYTASRDALFLRAGNLTVWDRVSDAATRWDRLRPDCWISTIPAEGMLLSPEGGGGCSCGGWIETSIGFAPKWRSW